MGLKRTLKTILLILVLIPICACTGTTRWKLSLPNDYEIRRISNKSVILGKIKDKEIVTEIDGVEVGVEEYVSKFSYSDNYIMVMCLIPNDDNIDIKYYIIDSKNDNRYGPYNDEETLNKVKEKIVDEELSDWIDTIEKPENAVLN